MSPTFTEDDVGKTVESATGEPLGIVAAVDEETAYVDPEPGLTGSIAAALGWEDAPDDAVPLADDAVERVTDDAIRLEAGFPEESVSTATDAGADERSTAVEPEAADHAPGEPVANDVSDAAIEADRPDRERTDRDGPTPRTDERGEPVRRTDERDDSTEERGAAGADAPGEIDSVESEASREFEVDPTELTDRDPEAEFEAGNRGRRTDAEVDPDAVREGVGGPTTEDGTDDEDGRRESDDRNAE